MYEEKSGFKFGEKVLSLDSKRAFESLIELLLEKGVINTAEWQQKLLDTDGVEIQKAPKSRRYKLVEVNDGEVQEE